MVKAAPVQRSYRMPKRWEDMTADEKLDALYAQLVIIGEFANRISRRVGAIEERLAAAEASRQSALPNPPQASPLA
jgi:uncharacterized protein with HEPN domain